MKTMYQTEDGKLYDSKKAALAHEELMAQKQNTEFTRINGPKFLPVTVMMPTMLMPTFSWYKVEGAEEFRKLKDAFRVQCFIHEPIFPDLIGISDRGDCYSLQNLRKEKKVEDESWERFFAEFKEQKET